MPKFHSNYRRCTFHPGLWTKSEHDAASLPAPVQPTLKTAPIELTVLQRKAPSWLSKWQSDQPPGWELAEWWGKTSHLTGHRFSLYQYVNWESPPTEHRLRQHWGHKVNYKFHTTLADTTRHGNIYQQVLLQQFSLCFITFEEEEKEEEFEIFFPFICHLKASAF